jgi:hypothetical protein
VHMGGLAATDKGAKRAEAATKNAIAFASSY